MGRGILESGSDLCVAIRYGVQSSAMAGFLRGCGADDCSLRVIGCL